MPDAAPAHDRSFQVRRAELPDLEPLRALLGHYFREEKIWEPDTEEAISAYLGRVDLGFFVAQAGEQLVGCVLCRPLPAIPGAAECKRLYVLPAFRGRGIAAVLIDAVEQATVEASLDSVYLDSNDDFRTAIALYLRLGYQPCERFNDNAQATVFLRKHLCKSWQPSGQTPGLKE